MHEHQFSSSGMSTFINGHLDTLYPALFRKKPKVNFERKRSFTEDGDFIDLDFSFNGSKRLVILSHGFEGSSQSQYILGMTDYLSKRGFDILAWNFRSCSGEINLAPIFYHSGATYDLKHCIDYVQKNYDYAEIHLVGFSMGGNISLKYLGEENRSLPKTIKSAACFSVPVDLADSAAQLKKGFGKLLYTPNFLRSLKKKVAAKKKVLSKLGIDWQSAMSSTNLEEFDNHITGPLHGFENAQHYYQTQSCNNFLGDIKIPSILVNSKNDPFLGSLCYPEIDTTNSCLKTFYPSFGGHVGFVQFGKSEYWSEKLALQHIEANSSFSVEP